MNFEQLVKIITNNAEKISTNIVLKQRLKTYIKNYFFLLNLKLKKLKLGLVSFEIKQYFFGNIFLYDIIEMRHSRQDTTEQDELKLENRLNAIKWKWDFQNVGALLIILIIVWFLLKNYFDILIKDLFYAFYDTERFEMLTCYTVKSSFDLPIFVKIPTYLARVNELFVVTLLKSFLYFKLF